MIYFFFLFFAPIVYLAFFSFTLKNLFVKAGKDGHNKPFLNILTWLEIIDKPKWWFLLFFVPVINYMTIYSMSFEMAYAFGVRGWFNLFKHGMLNFIFLPILDKKEKLVYVDPKLAKAKAPATKSGKTQNTKREGTNEWLDSIVYALIAATVSRALS